MKNDVKMVTESTPSLSIYENNILQHLKKQLISPSTQRIYIVNCFVVIALCFHMQGKDALAQSVSLRAKKSPIVIKISPSKIKLCLGNSELKLEMELTNVSTKTVIFDKKQLWRGAIEVEYRKGKIFDYRSKERFAEIPYEGDYIKIAPQEKYQDTYNFLFVDENTITNDFFNRTGNYTIKYTYASQTHNYKGNDKEIKNFLYVKPTASNSIEFKILNCEGNSLKAFN